MLCNYLYNNSMNNWSNFFLAQVGASAALTGLLFVALSINVRKITSNKPLLHKALISLLLLFIVLVVSSLTLIPLSTVHYLGIGVFILGGISWFVVTTLHTQARKTLTKKYLRYYIRDIILNQLATVPFLVAGILFFMNNEIGYYWLVPGILFSILSAGVTSWILLIEINNE